MGDRVNDLKNFGLKGNDYYVSKFMFVKFRLMGVCAHVFTYDDKSKRRRNKENSSPNGTTKMFSSVEINVDSAFVGFLFKILMQCESYRSLQFTLVRRVFVLLNYERIKTCRGYWE